MPNSRRIKIDGGCFFFTVCLADRRATTLIDHVEDLQRAWRWTQERKPFASPAWAVLPDHIHCIWKLPPDDDDYAVRWKMLRAQFTRSLTLKQAVPEGRRAGERNVWQRRFWEHAIRDDTDMENHMAYIRGNPVRHGYVTRFEDWPIPVFIKARKVHVHMRRVLISAMVVTKAQTRRVHVHMSRVLISAMVVTKAQTRRVHVHMHHVVTSAMSVTKAPTRRVHVHMHHRSGNLQLRLAHPTKWCIERCTLRAERIATRGAHCRNRLS